MTHRGTKLLATVAVPAAIWLGCAPDLRVGEPPGSGGAGGIGGGVGGGASGEGGGTGGGAGGGVGGGAQGLPVWSRAFGGEGDQAGIAVAADSAGNLVVVGQLGGSADFGGDTLESAGSDDIFVAWLDADGGVTRRMRFGDGNPQEVRAVALRGDGGVLLAGSMSGTLDFGGETWTSAGGRDGYVAKLGPDGEPAWGLRFGDAGYQVATGVTVDAAGNVMVAGVFSGEVALGDVVTSAGGYDALVAKLGVDGTPLWSRKFGGALDQRAHGIAADMAGGAVVVGEFAGIMDTGGSSVESAGAEDAFAVKIGAGGDVIWSRRYGDAKAQVARRVAADGEGGVVIGGEFVGSVDLGGGPLAGSGLGGLFVGRIDGDGNHVWSKGFPGSGASRLEGLAVDEEGGVVITGVLAGSLEIGEEVLVSVGEEDLFAARLDASGRVLWVRRYGDGAAQRGQGVAVDGAGAAVVVGRFAGTLEVGGEAIESVGGNEALVMKLSR